MRSRETKREAQILVHSADAYLSRGGAEVRLGNLFRFFMLVAGSQELEPTPAASQDLPSLTAS